MTITDIKRLLSKSFQNTIKNIVSLGDDSTLEANRKPLKIGGKTTPLELSTDNVYVNGQEIDLKYQYHFFHIGYYAQATTVYFPISGYILEGTSTTGRNEQQSLVAPYDGTIEKVMYRSEAAQNGTLEIDIHESADGTEIPAASPVGTKDTSINISDDTTQEISFASMTSGSNAITKGRIYAIRVTTPSATYDTNVTVVFKWDITS